jgi:hypothetical protein
MSRTDSWSCHGACNPHHGLAARGPRGAKPHLHLALAESLLHSALKGWEDVSLARAILVSTRKPAAPPRQPF